MECVRTGMVEMLYLSKLNIAPRHTPPTFLKTLIFFFGDIG